MRKLIIILACAVVISALPAWWPQSLAQNDTATFTSGAYLSSDGSAIQLADIYSIQMTSWLPQAKKASTLELQRNAQGNWILPQHHNYPVNHPSMLGATIGSIITLKKRHLETTDSERFPDLSVVAPDSLRVASSKEKGQRLTLKDKNGQIILDIIWGLYNNTNEYTYVRNVGSDEVYTTSAHLSMNIDHNAWIQKRLIPYDYSNARSLESYTFNGKPYQEKTRFHIEETLHQWVRNGKTIPQIRCRMYVESHIYISFIDILSKTTVTTQQLLDNGFRLDDQQRISNGAIVFTLTFDNTAQFTVILGNTFNHRGKVCRMAQITVNNSNRSASELSRYHNFYYIVDESTLLQIRKGGDLF